MSILVLFLAIPDPERLIPRAVNSLAEANQFLTSYQNSIMFTKEHDTLVNVIRKLEKAERELRALDAQPFPLRVRP
jgi:hypothetical protein